MIQIHVSIFFLLIMSTSSMGSARGAAHAYELYWDNVRAYIYKILRASHEEPAPSAAEAIEKEKIEPDRVLAYQFMVDALNKGQLSQRDIVERCVSYAKSLRFEDDK